MISQIEHVFMSMFGIYWGQGDCVQKIPVKFPT